MPEKSNIQPIEVNEIPKSFQVQSTKKWSAYFLEFFLIFLAVTLGFFAESYRDYLSEHEKEKEYAKTLYYELLTDSIAISNKLKDRLDKESHMDYLDAYFKDSSLIHLPKGFYPAFTKGFYLFNTYTFEPKDGILSQLKNSGSLRYFKSIALQKLLGDISVDINNIRVRNEQEYQFFSDPIKQFLLEHYNWSWLDQLRKEDFNPTILEVLKRYSNSDNPLKAKILNLDSFD